MNRICIDILRIPMRRTVLAAFSGSEHVLNGKSTSFGMGSTGIQAACKPLSWLDLQIEITRGRGCPFRTVGVQGARRKTRIRPGSSTHLEGSRGGGENGHFSTGFPSRNQASYPPSRARTLVKPSWSSAATVSEVLF